MPEKFLQIQKKGLKKKGRDKGERYESCQRRKKDFYNLQAAREHRREYMRNYMQQARAAGKVKHWRQYLKEKSNDN